MIKQYRYKLTDQNIRTHGGTEWSVGKWRQTTGNGELCTKGWLHCYCDPVLAVLHNPIHANIESPRLWLVEVRGKCLRDRDVKEGWTEVRLVEELDLPEVTLTQRVAYGILCSLEVYREPSYIEWARNWLSGQNRSHYDAARSAARAGARAAARAAAAACDYATYATADYADYVDYAAYAARAGALAATDPNRSVSLVIIASKALQF